jgi:hypothetical protein
MVLKKDDDTAKSSDTSDDKTTELPAGGAVTENTAPTGSALADTDYVARTKRSQQQVLKKGEADPTEVVDKEHVEVAGGKAAAPDPTVPAPGTLLPKDPGVPPQGDAPGRHVPAPRRTDAEGRPLN